MKINSFFIKVTLFALSVIIIAGIMLVPITVAAADDFDSARSINVNSIVTDRLETKGIVKYYKFELYNPGKVYLTFNHNNTENNGNRWQIHLFDSATNVILDFISPGKETSTDSVNAYLASGTYYIRVRISSGYTHSSADYNLSVSYEQNTGQYEIEPNNETTTATLIGELGKPITGNINPKNDVDYYRFNVSNPGDFSITFNHKNTENNGNRWQIHLFDSATNAILDFTSTGKVTSTDSIKTYLASGTYVFAQYPVV